MIHRHIATIGGLLTLALLSAGTQANAQAVRFHSNGGHWSHSQHNGWNRYWGGPSIGFYYAPTPVYVVSGYSAPSYYSGSNFWYSNPSFGLNVNVGGGGRGNYRNSGHYSGSNQNGGHYSGGNQNGGSGHYQGGNTQNNRSSGAHIQGNSANGGGHSQGGNTNGGHAQGGNTNGGGHSQGGQGRR